MITPLAVADSLRVGSVDFVSPDEIKVLLDIEAPNDVALNTGVPRPFPRINSYVLLPSDSGFLVAQIVWITIERSQYPKRKGLQDFGVIDLPFPLRNEYYRAFTVASIQTITTALDTQISALGGLVYEENDTGEDMPLPFNVSEFADYIQMLGIEEKASQFIDFLVMRIRTLIADKRISTISVASDMTFDPDYWDVRTGRKERKVNWEEIALDWQGSNETQTTDKTEQGANAKINGETFDDSDYGDYLCHVQLDESARPKDSDDDDNDLPF